MPLHSRYAKIKIVPFPYILPIKDVIFDHRLSINQVGYLAKKLFRLQQHEIPITATYVVPISTLKQISQANDLLSEVKHLLTIENSQSKPNTTRLLKKIKQLIIEQRIPTEINERILKKYHSKLKGDFVQIKASYLSKDRTTNGNTQQNVLGDANFLHSLLEVWSAAVVLEKLGKLYLYPAALVVQQQPQPLSSGLAYTQYFPHDKLSIHLNSVWGVMNQTELKIKADSFSVHHHSLQVTSKKISLQKKQLKRKSDKLIITKVPLFKQRKPSINDSQVLQLAKLTIKIKKLFLPQQTIAWYLDNKKIVVTESTDSEENLTLSSHLTLASTLHSTISAQPQPLLTGTIVNAGVVTAKCRVVMTDKDAARTKTGEILIVKQLTPKHTILLTKVSAIITDHEISSPLLFEYLREHHLPTLTNTKIGTKILKTGQKIVVDATSGTIFREGAIAQIETITTSKGNLEQKPVKTLTKLLISAGNPDKAKSYVTNLVDGVGVLRSEYAFAKFGDHPLHVLGGKKKSLLKKALLDTIVTFQQACGVKPVIYRSQNFTTNELRQLSNAKNLEPKELNPYLGHRGAIKIISNFDLFNLELEVIKQALSKSNKKLSLMLSFVRTPSELKLLILHIKKSGLFHYKKFKLYLQLNTPENILQLSHYLQPEITGFSLNVRSLHSLLVGIDPDSPAIYSLYSLDVSLIENLMTKVLSTIRQSPTRKEVILHLEDHNLPLVEAATKLSLTAVTVKPDFSAMAKKRIREVEEKRLQ